MSLKCSWKFRWSVMQAYNLKRVQFDVFLYTVGLQPEALFFRCGLMSPSQKAIIVSLQPTGCDLADSACGVDPPQVKDFALLSIKLHEESVSPLLLFVEVFSNGYPVFHHINNLSNLGASMDFRRACSVPSSRSSKSKNFGC